MNKQHGFSLIELIIVVVILSLLAVTALPRFVNISEQAEDASVEGVAGGFSAAGSSAAGFGFALCCGVGCCVGC